MALLWFGLGFITAVVCAMGWFLRVTNDATRKIHHATQMLDQATELHERIDARLLRASESKEGQSDE